MDNRTFDEVMFSELGSLITKVHLSFSPILSAQTSETNRLFENFHKWLISCPVGIDYNELLSTIVYIFISDHLSTWSNS